MKKNTTGIRRLLLASVCAGVTLMAATAAMAQGATYNFNIPSEDLAKALKEFGAASNTQVLFDGALVKNATSPALVGNYTASEGLKVLLAGRNLTYRTTDAGVVLISAQVSSQAPAAASAATPAADEVPAEEPVVVVTGFRASLANALNIKRRSNGVVDVIKAEDISKFPDANLAESLQRVPGVSIARVAGEGRTITVRGLPPGFTRVRVNGMEAQSTSGATTSDRGQNQGRGFDFNTFSSDLFNSLTVRKTAAAEITEGSLGATVDLATMRPFDFKGSTLVVSGAVGYNSLSEASNDHKFSVVASNRWTTSVGEVGVLFSLAASKRKYFEDQWGSGGWNPATTDGGFCTPVGVTPQTPATDASHGTDAANCATGVARPAANDTLYALGNQSTVFFPRLPRYGRFTHDQERTGATLSLQWRPSTDTLINFDAVYSDYNVIREENWLEGFSFARAISQNGKPQTAIRELILRPAGISQTQGVNFGKPVFDVAYARFDGVDARSDTQHDEFENVFTQYTLNGTHRFNDRLNFTGLIGYSKSDFDQRAQTTIMFQRQNAGMTIDLRRNRDQPIITWNFDVANPDNYSFSSPGSTAAFANAEVRMAPAKILNTYKTVEGAFDWQATNMLKLKGGMHYDEFAFDIQAWQRANNFDVPTLTAQQLRDLSRTATFEGKGLDDGVFPAAWATIDYNKFVANQNLYSNTGMYALIKTTGNFRHVDEKITSAFVQAEINTEVGGMPLRGDAGVRYAETKMKSSGFIVGQTTPTEVEHKYSDVLPSFNVTLEMQPDLLLRLSAAKVVVRPELSFLTPGGSLTLSGTPSLTSGNPFLKPIRATTVDLSGEWYFAPNSLLSLGLFYKDIGSYIQNQSQQMSFTQTGLPLSLIGTSGVDPVNTPITVTRPVNTPGGPLKGYEFNYQQGFTFLPGLLSKTGVLFNYTFVDSKITYILAAGGTTTAPLIGLSRNAFNTTLYYEDEKYSARISAAYRDKYIAPGGLPANNPLQDYEGVDKSLVFDLAASYQVNSHLKLTLEGLNIFDRFNRLFIDSTRNSDFVYSHLGAQWNLGAKYKF